MASERTEPCSRCDGTAVIVDERRLRDRTASTVADDFTRLRNATDLVIAHQAGQIDRLLAEVRRLQEAVHKAAQAIESKAFRTKGDHHASTN